MDVNDLPGNSYIDKNEPVVKERKSLGPVVTGEITTQKKSFGRKLAETFTGDDAQTVGNYILMDVAVPALKNLIVDVITEGAERAFFGGGRRANSPIRTSHTNYTNYSRQAASPTVVSREGNSVIRVRNSSPHEFDEFVIASRPEAEIVIEKIGELIGDYGMATVSDLYDLLGKTGSYADEKWGWTDISTASVQRVRRGQGYQLILPAPKPIG